MNDDLEQPFDGTVVESIATNEVTWQFAKYISCYFDPQPDITAYELAKLLPWFRPGQRITEDDWTALGEMTRHLKRS